MEQTDYLPDYLRNAMLLYAEQVMENRPADFTAGENYLERWRLANYGSMPNAYIHRFRSDDEDGALHDHPYDNVSVILKGSYLEHFHTIPFSVGNDGKYTTYSVLRREGGIIKRSADVAHRLSMINNEPVVTMFFTGTRYREWGFHCVSGWVHYNQFLTDNGGKDR
jgi:hypothetical protein